MGGHLTGIGAQMLARAAASPCAGSPRPSRRDRVRGTVAFLLGATPFLSAGGGCGSPTAPSSVSNSKEACDRDALEESCLPDASDAGAAEEAGTDEGDASVDALSEDSSAADGPIAPEAGTVECLIRSTPPASPGSARSAGYAGTDDGHQGLYGVSCLSASDCASDCTDAGGTNDSCTSRSECLPGEASDGGPGCIPPTYWSNASFLAGGDAASPAQLILVDTSTQDSLLLQDFGIELPDGAVITGIYVTIDRDALDSNATDGVVQLLRDGVAVGSNRATTAPWPATFKPANYGGAYDTWGTTWAADDLQATTFGISITPSYAGPSSANETVSVNAVQITVYFKSCL